MRLAERIEAARMEPEVLAAFRAGLEEVAGVGGFSSMEQMLLSSLFDSLILTEVEPAPFEDLWPYRDLFLTAALTCAISGGRYGVDEARKIGTLASRLGCSPTALAVLEDKVFSELHALGRTLKRG